MPQTRAVQGRPRETSRRKEPPRLRPPQEPPCRAGSGWPQVPPQREWRRVLGPGTRGGCVPAAPAAFQEQYCWHQAGSLHRQHIHGPFMRGVGMIYCLGEGAGAGGWSPSMPAPGPLCMLAAAGPRTCKQGRGSGQGVVSPNGAWDKSRSLCPICGVLGTHFISGHPAVSELSNHGSHIPCGATVMEAAHELRETGTRGGCWGRGAPTPQSAVLAQSPLVELLAWQRLLWCCRQRVAGGGAGLL